MDYNEQGRQTKFCEIICVLHRPREKVRRRGLDYDDDGDLRTRGAQTRFNWLCVEKEAG